MCFEYRSRKSPLDSSNESGPNQNFNANSQQPGFRDPNMPPGFENEYRNPKQPPLDPRSQFNPEADMYPPGGKYPTLSPMTGIGTHGDGRNNGPGAGMTPEPFGFNKPPSIRYDPTNPSDNTSSSFGFPGNQNSNGFNGFGGFGGSN